MARPPATASTGRFLSAASTDLAVAGGDTGTRGPGGGGAIWPSAVAVALTRRDAEGMCCPLFCFWHLLDLLQGHPRGRRAADDVPIRPDPIEGRPDGLSMPCL